MTTKEERLDCLVSRKRHRAVRIKERRLRSLFEKNRKEIMRSVHCPNAFGQTESQIDFFLRPGDLVITVHATPSYTEYHSLQPELSLIIEHNPFFSYQELDERFEQALEEWKRAAIEDADGLAEESVTYHVQEVHSIDPETYCSQYKDFKPRQHKNAMVYNRETDTYDLKKPSNFRY